MHPLFKNKYPQAVSLAQLVEQLTLNQWVESSSLSGDTRDATRLFFILYPIVPSLPLPYRLVFAIPAIYGVDASIYKQLTSGEILGEEQTPDEEETRR